MENARHSGAFARNRANAKYLPDLYKIALAPSPMNVGKNWSQIGTMKREG
jgi:hypothetical protein